MNTKDDPAAILTDLLTEVQHELWAREWPADSYERIKMAADFRGKLWDAAAAYADSYREKDY